MKIIHLLKTANGATWAYRQICALRRLGVDVQVAMPTGGVHDPLYSKEGILVHELQTDISTMRTPGRYLAARACFRALVEGGGFDIVHSHFVGTSLFARLALGPKHGTPRIFQVPGPLHLENPVTRFVDLKSAGSPDFWLASCRATGQIYRRCGVSADRVGLAYYGLDLQSFSNVAPIDLRSELGLAAGTKLIGMVAYVYAPKRWLGQRRGLKGHEDLIDAVSILLSKGLDVTCIFVGGPWAGAVKYEQSLRRYAEQRLGKRAVFLGNRSDVLNIYPNFDVAVHPSHSENVGGAAESLLLGVPTVASNVGGLPDVVDGENTGWLSPPYCPSLLAERIEEALANPAEATRRGKNGRDLVMQLFDVERTASDVLKFYRHVLQRAHRKHTRVMQNGD